MDTIERPTYRECDSCSALAEDTCDGCGGFFCKDDLFHVSSYVKLCSECVEGRM